MKVFNKYRWARELDIAEGDQVELVVRSALYCGEGEEPEYHIGTVTEFYSGTFSDGEHIIGCYIKFRKDDLYEDGDEELIMFEDVEDIFKKEYDVIGYGMINEGMTLSIKGNGVGKTIWWEYRNGSLIPVSASEGSITQKRRITPEDEQLIRNIRKYSAYQKFSHFVLANSK